MSITSIAPSSRTGRFRTAQGGQFFQYFKALQEKCGPIVPPRKYLDPRSAKPFLPYLFIQEVIDPETVMMRLIGTVIVSRTGVDGTGRNFLELMNPEMRAASWGHLRRLLDTPCGSRMVCTETYEGKNLVTEMVSFPFADSNGEARFVVALSAEVDLQDLALRGNWTAKFGEVIELEYLDIGAGYFPQATASPLA